MRCFIYSCTDSFKVYIPIPEPQRIPTSWLILVRLSCMCVWRLLWWLARTMRWARCGLIKDPRRQQFLPWHLGPTQASSNKRHKHISSCLVECVKKSENVCKRYMMFTSKGLCTLSSASILVSSIILFLGNICIHIQVIYLWLCTLFLHVSSGFCIVPVGLFGSAFSTSTPDLQWVAMAQFMTIPIPFWLQVLITLWHKTTLWTPAPHGKATVEQKEKTSNNQPFIKYPFNAL